MPALLPLAEPVSDTPASPWWALGSAAVPGVRGPIAEPPRRAGGRARTGTVAARTARAQAVTQTLQQAVAQGDVDAAFAIGRHAWNDWLALRAPEGRCEVALLMATAAIDADWGVEALALLRHAFAAARARGLRSVFTRTLTLMATLHARMADDGAAETLALQALSRARELRDPRTVQPALHGLLTVLLASHDRQTGRGEAAAAQATAQRLLRHAHQACGHGAHSPQALEDPLQLRLRLQGAAALQACGRDAEAARLRAGCADAAAAQGLTVAEGWARLLDAAAALTAGDLAAAALPRRDDGPPWLQQAVTRHRARVAAATGHPVLAAREQQHERALRQRHARTAQRLQSLLARNADDVLGTLPLVDGEWLQSPVSGD